MRSATLLTAVTLTATGCSPGANELFRSGVEAQLAGKDGVARAAYKRALRRTTRIPGIENNLALLDMKRAAWAEADALLLRELDRNPDLADAAANRVLLQLLEGDPNDARALAAKATAAFPKRALVHFAAGLAWRGGDDTKAAASFAEAIAHGKRTMKARAAFQLGLLEAGRGKHDAAAQAFTTVTKHRRDAIAFYNLALVQTRAGKLDDALAALKSGSALDPEAALIPALEAHVQARSGQVDAAFDAIKRAKKLDPTLLGLDALRGELLVQRRAPREAVDAFRAEATHTIEGKNPFAKDSWFALGLLAVELSDYAEARKAFTAAAELDPKDTEAVRNRDVLAKMTEGAL